MGECCQELFDFISECINCTRLIIVNVIDNTDKNSDLSHHHPVAIKKLIRLITPNVKGNKDKNSDLSHHLSVSIKNLTRLIEIDIRDTNLSGGWREVLDGQGEVLEGLLTRLPQLRILGLNDSGLGWEEMLGVLYQLPVSSPLLQGLLVTGHDLSKAGDRLVQALTGLPKIRLLNIGNCKLPGTVISHILHQINTDIEVLLLDRNQPVPGTGPSVIDHIKQCQSLQYMKVSSSQFTKTALSQLDSSLSAHGGHLLVDVTSKHKEWGDVNKQFNRIRDECLNE